MIVVFYKLVQVLKVEVWELNCLNAFWFRLVHREIHLLVLVCIFHCLPHFLNEHPTAAIVVVSKLLFDQLQRFSELWFCPFSILCCSNISLLSSSLNISDFILHSYQIFLMILMSECTDYNFFYSAWIFKITKMNIKK